MKPNGWIIRCGITAGLLLGICLGGACKKESSRQLYLGAYTAPREAFREINKKFEAKWQQDTGEKIKVKESYLSSGAQSRAVVDGFEADVVALSLDTDIDRLVQAGLIKSPWRQGPANGVLTRSVVAFAVRPGNPKEVHDWKDLLQPGLEVLTPNPKTSGGAQWNVLAAYGAAVRGKVPGFPATPKGATQYLSQLISQVTAMDKGARESILTFERGLGDVALSYENEIREGQVHDNDYELILPSSTILIENPVAIVDKYVDRHGNRDLAEAYLQFLFSPEAQEIFMQRGFRPILPDLLEKNSKNFPPIPDTFTVEIFGGWKEALPKFFGGEGIFTKAAEQTP